jgi:hypothetical protein
VDGNVTYYVHDAATFESTYKKSTHLHTALEAAVESEYRTQLTVQCGVEKQQRNHKRLYRERTMAAGDEERGEFGFNPLTELFPACEELKAFSPYLFSS